jgi:hypothetical protein
MSIRVPTLGEWLAVALLPANAMAVAPCYPGTATHIWYLRDVPAYLPLVAEPHPDAIRLSFGTLSQYQYARSIGTRYGADLDVGGELPLFGCVKGGYSTRPSQGEFKIGVYIPVSFHMLWDLHDPSNPIINNDYRFSYAMVKGIYGFGEHGPLPTHAEFRWRVYEHESSHLGDELTIAAEDSVLHGGPPFNRVNVSYQFRELAAGLRWENFFDGSLAVRIGDVLLVNPDGFYGDTITSSVVVSPGILSIQQRAVAPSTRRGEPYGEIEARWHAFLVSMNATNRIVLDFDKAPGALEARQWSFNVIAGFQNPTEMFGDVGHPDVFVRYYSGVNPHGQFRSQRSFHMFGLGARIRT